MKKYLSDAILGLGGRDDYFRQILLSFYPNELSILQIGAIEEKKRAWRHGSGWSDIFFASYIETCGGSLDVVDFDADHLKNSESLISDFNIDFSVNLSEASKFISSMNKSYDIVYLDAGNDPEETKNQYDLLDKESISLIMVDDEPLKGTTIQKHEIHEHRSLPFFRGENSMGIYLNKSAFISKFGNKNKAKEKLLKDEILI